MRFFTTRLSNSNNSSKVESLARALVAAVFLIALWLDPAEPVRDDLAGEALLAGYLAWSIGLIAIARSNWWWDHRLARVAHVIDIAVFIAAVYYTEAPSTDFASPFMAFAVLLLIKARIRWDWRSTMATALILLVLNLAIAGTMAWTGYPIDLQRVGRRAAYMLLLAVLVVWMGLERRVTLDRHFPLLPPEPVVPRPAMASSVPGPVHPFAPLITAALGFARRATGASHAAIAWSAEQEPWIDLGIDPGVDLSVDLGVDLGVETAAAGEATAAAAHLRITRLGPDLPGGADLARWADLAGCTDLPGGALAMLFDSRHGRALVFDAGRRRAIPLDQAPPLAARLGVDTGIAVPIASDAGNGQLLLWGLVDPCFDRLALACQAAEEIGRAFEREERARLEQAMAVAGAVSRVREAIARDLHDSAAQFLAGTMFRLEALRRSFGAEQVAQADGEIVAIKHAMRIEQAELRALIGQLRRGHSDSQSTELQTERQTDLARELDTLLGELGAHWRLATTLDHPQEPIMVPVSLSHELRQLVREGVANAARHGGGDRVDLELAATGASLQLVIADNGCGFPASASSVAGVRPKSIEARVAALGGSLAITAAEPHGARLLITLPLRPMRAGQPVSGESLATLA